MKRFAFLLCLLILAAGCLVEDKPVGSPNDGGVDAGPCGTCPAVQPVCNDALECVQCTADDDDYCTNQGLICDVGSSSCVGCTDDDECTQAAAARCDNNVCRPCTERAHCDSVDGIGVAESACDEGLCVDCTPESEDATCPGEFSCNPASKECTTTKVGGLDVCEECVSDSDCGDGGEASDAFRCVPMFYETVGNRFPNADSGFCLKTTEGGCQQPYSITLSMRQSLSGEPDDDYCGINEDVATCPAVKALVDNQTCEGGTPEECPQPSGLCEQVGDLETPRCTYRCISIIECLVDNPEGRPGSTCGSSGSGNDDYCGG